VNGKQEILKMSEEMANWPEWLLESYGTLPLPSLHDFILSQEKLSVEIKKQNREIKSSGDQLHALSKQVTEALAKLPTEVPDDGWEGCEELLRELLGEDGDDDADDEDSAESEASVLSAEAAIAQQLLMQAMDSLFHLFNGIDSGNQKILKTLPKIAGVWSPKKPEWRTYIEEVLEGYLDGIVGMRQKLAAQMADLGIELLSPTIGSHFDPMVCRAVERTPGDNKGAIAQLIRYGYKINGKIVRFADVAIYQ
jgi:hypothetical protein